MATTVIGATPNSSRPSFEFLGFLQKKSFNGAARSACASGLFRRGGSKGRDISYAVDNLEETRGRLLRGTEFKILNEKLENKRRGRSLQVIAGMEGVGSGRGKEEGKNEGTSRKIETSKELIEKSSHYPAGFEWMEQDDDDGLSLEQYVGVLASLTLVFLARNWLLKEIAAAVKLVLFISSSFLILLYTLLVLPLFYLGKLFLPSPALTLLSKFLIPLSTFIESIDISTLSFTLALAFPLLFAAQQVVLNPRSTSLLLWPATALGVGFISGYISLPLFIGGLVAVSGVSFLVNKKDPFGIATPAFVSIAGFIQAPRFVPFLALGVYLSLAVVAYFQGFSNAKVQGIERDSPVYDRTRLGVHFLLWLGAVVLAIATVRQRFFEP